MRVAQIMATLVATFLLSCEAQKSVASSISTHEAKELSDALNRLDAALKLKAPIIHANLNGGATPGEISQLRGALDGNSVQVLESWFAWHNGAIGEPSQLLPLGSPLSMSESLEDRRRIGSIPIVDDLRKNAVKILDDGAGDGFFIDVASPQPLVFYHMLEDPSPQYFGTLAEFVGFIATGFESGALFIDASGKFGYDEKAYETLETNHLKTATTP